MLRWSYLWASTLGWLVGWLAGWLLGALVAGLSGWLSCLAGWVSWFLVKMHSMMRHEGASLEGHPLMYILLIGPPIKA